jgi:hypothetical protein
MTKDKWGPGILVTIIDCKKPGAASAGKPCAIWTKGIWHGEDGSMEGRNWHWHSAITAIKLLADDPYYQTLAPDEPEVTIEALEAAAKYAGLRDPKYNTQGILENPRHYKMPHALARLLMKHEPHLIEKSFEERTAAEFGVMWAHGQFVGLEQYRKYVKQHIEEASK